MHKPCHSILVELLPNPTSIQFFNTTLLGFMCSGVYYLTPFPVSVVGLQVPHK